MMLNFPRLQSRGLIAGSLTACFGRRELIEELIGVDDARGADGQTGSAQSLCCPGVAGMREIERSARNIKDASGMGAGTDALEPPFCDLCQIIPEELPKTCGARS